MIIFVTLILALTASARSLQKVRVSRRAAFDLANGQAAITLKCARIIFYWHSPKPLSQQKIQDSHSQFAMYRAGRCLREQQICAMRGWEICYFGLCSWDRVGAVLYASVGCYTHANIFISCAALPLVNSPGTSITCTTEADLAARIATVCQLL